MIDPELKDEGGPGRASDATLRQFAALCGLVLGAAAIRDLWFRDATTRGSVLAVVAVSIALVGLARPRTIRPLFSAALAVTMPIGMVVSAVLLAVMYFLIFTPLAFVFRLAGRDALARRRHPGAASYWRAKDIPKDVRSYFRQS
jgi:hypothetical protein